MSMLRKYTDLELPLGEAMILAETDGHTREDVRYQMDRLLDLFRKCKAREVHTAKSEEEAERLWLVRKSLGAVTGHVMPNQAPEDVTVPMSRISEFLRKTEDISKKHGLLILNYGHAGDGNLHPNVLYDASDPKQYAALKPTLLDLHKLACDLGGTLTGEHGIGITKARYMTLEHNPAALKAMRSVKRALDPNNILNPGKMALDDG